MGSLVFCCRRAPAAAAAAAMAVLLVQETCRRWRSYPSIAQLPIPPRLWKGVDFSVLASLNWSVSYSFQVVELSIAQLHELGGKAAFFRERLDKVRLFRLLGRWQELCNASVCNKVAFFSEAH